MIGLNNFTNTERQYIQWQQVRFRPLSIHPTVPLNKNNNPKLCPTPMEVEEAINHWPLPLSLLAAKKSGWPLRYAKSPLFVAYTAGINRSNTAVRAVLEQPCSTGGRTGTVRPKQEPTGRTDLSDRSRLVLCDRSQELIGQACPTRRQVLRSDSACPTISQTRLFEHRSNCRVRPVNAGSVSAAVAVLGISTYLISPKQLQSLYNNHTDTVPCQKFQPL
ncbi:hypothetical protein PCANC_05209 [Puccinia coronata f. sp. avenae]|uniref:Uncharacterized protein n=1 Tax=Puccinia coronata f. sp. avenae TaxID=200324 RepID=A0A2N5VW66_9BASI|nr:hypothetical protein PCASD_25677 [Puccinia coronata f. sp. avenae]PLW54248.1 hypothetical protein PCANC_05209 [Puccinia coronata f. sp. avenae]